MLRLSVLGALALMAAAAFARPQTGATWTLPDGYQTSGSIARAAGSPQFHQPEFQNGGFQPVRQGRRIATDTLTNSVTTTTTPAAKKKGKKLVTLRPIGNNIQEILFNNGYRETPGEHEPELNNIDDYDNLGGLHPDDVWLLDDNFLVLKGGALSEGFIDAEPIDDYVAPYREPKFPPPGFNPDGILPPGSAGSFLQPQRPSDVRQPEAFIPEYGYNPYNSGREGRAPGYRAVLPPPGFQYPSGTPTASPAAARPAHSPRRTHAQASNDRFTGFSTPPGYINNFDGLPHSFSSSNSYPAPEAPSAAPQYEFAEPEQRKQEPPAAASEGIYVGPNTTVLDGNGNYMTYTNHDNGYSYSYKTDGQ